MKKIIKILSVLLIAIAILSVIIWQSGQNQNLKVYFFDVGQGDGILIRTPSHQNIIIDGGPDNSFITQLGQTLPFYDRTIDLMVLTHPHDDHIFGLVEVIKRYKVKQVLYSGALHTTAAYLEWLRIIKEKQIPFKISLAGQNFVFGQVQFKVIYPYEGFAGKIEENLNNSSVAAQLVFGRVKMLFMGDLEIENEEAIIRLSATDIQSQVIKLGHHGSDTSSSEEFIKTVNPEYAIISVGQDNKFGHPARRILKRLKRLGVKYFRTDLAGTILLISDGQSIISALDS